MIYPGANFGEPMIASVVPDADINLIARFMGPTWAPGGPHVGHVNLAIWVANQSIFILGQHKGVLDKKFTWYIVYIFIL